MRHFICRPVLKYLLYSELLNGPHYYVPHIKVFDDINLLKKVFCPLVEYIYATLNIICTIIDHLM